VTSRTLDGRKIVVLVDSDRNPGDFYLIDRESRKAEYLLSRRSWIDPAAMAPVEAITYRTRDGATIHAYLTAAAGASASKAPLVVVPHGGPHGPRDFWAWDPWAQALASRGYAVLQPNFRGSGGYGYAHQSAGYRKWGTLMQDDLTDAVKWAVGQGIADPARVCIMGGSYGGYAALMSPTREPDLYRCAIGFAGVYDLISQSEDSDIPDSLMGRNYLEEVLGDAATMREQSPVTHIEKLRVPVLIAHGTADKRVPFSQAKVLRKALKKHDKAFEWAEYEDEEHGFWIEKNHEDFLTRALTFLDRHIGAAAPAAASAQTQ
jgi:dipeptidyl aminopeptidase/acylaminoacyl peptidase